MVINLGANLKVRSEEGVREYRFLESRGSFLGRKFDSARVLERRLKV